MLRFSRARALSLLGLLALILPTVASAQSAQPTIAPMTPAPSSTPCASGRSGQLVVAPTGSVSSPKTPGLVVLDAATGKTLRSVQMPLVTEVIPTNYPNDV